MMQTATMSFKAPAARSAAAKANAPIALLPRLKAGVIAVGAAALLATGPAALAADLVVGEEVFNNNCAACHTSGQNVVQAEKTLQKGALEQYLEGGFNTDAIEYQVTNGKNAMPAWGDRLSEEEIQGVAAYVFKQAEGSLW